MSESENAFNLRLPGFSGSSKSSGREETDGNNRNPVPYLPAFPQSDFDRHYLASTQKHIKLAVFSAFALYAIFGVLDYYLAQSVVSTLLTIRYTMVCPVILLVFLLLHIRLSLMWTQLLVGAAALIGGLAIVGMTIVAPPPANYLYYAGLFIFLSFGFNFLYLLPRYALPVCWSVILLYVAAVISFGQLPVAVIINNTFFLLSAGTVGTFSNISQFVYIRRDFLQARQIDAEREKADKLLLNILPASIAERLKYRGQLIADHYEEATILFADIVGFTPLSASLRPDQLVEMLNTIFTKFDVLTVNRGLEKIKTIGDAYMVAAGVPVARIDHVEAIADLSVEMHEFIRQFNQAHGTSLSLRIGINTGEVVAGVIGINKFAYDLWGETVNLASRMESHGLPGMTQVSESTFRKLQSTYKFDVRNEVVVKGVGKVNTYIILQRIT